MKRYIPYLFAFFFLVACDATKQVPEGSYLLNKVDIDTDTKTVSESHLKSFCVKSPILRFPFLEEYAYICIILQETTLHG